MIVEDQICKKSESLRKVVCVFYQMKMKMKFVMKEETRLNESDM